MMSFSERMKLVPEKQIQTNDIDAALRHRLINRVADEFDDSQARYVLDVMGFRTIPEKDVYVVSFNRGGKNLDKLTQALGEIPWNYVYDVLEYGYQYIEKTAKDVLMTVLFLKMKTTKMMDFVSIEAA